MARNVPSVYSWFQFYFFLYGFLDSIIFLPTFYTERLWKFTNSISFAKSEYAIYEGLHCKRQSICINCISLNFILWSLACISMHVHWCLFNYTKMWHSAEVARYIGEISKNVNKISISAFCLLFYLLLRTINIGYAFETAQRANH